MTSFAEPGHSNGFLEHHIKILRESLRHWLGQDLVEPALDNREAAEFLYNAPFALLSHDSGADPLFNYANKIAQQLFAMNWSRMNQTYSRCCVEPGNQEERDRLLRKVSSRGYVDQYQGVRISGSGRRFLISNAMVWNLIGPDGNFYGQAAKFGQWETLDEKNT